MRKTEEELQKLDISRNKKRTPKGSSEIFIRGWRDREAGIIENPYAAESEADEAAQWNAGQQARAEIGFDYSHRIGSKTHLGPFYFD